MQTVPGTGKVAPAGGLRRLAGCGPLSILPILALLLAACGGSGGGSDGDGSASDVILGSLEFPDSDHQGFGIVQQGDRVFIAAGVAGVLVVDVSDPASPAIIGSNDAEFLAGTMRISPTNFLYAAASTAGVRVLNITDPSAPTFQDQGNTPGNTSEITFAIGASAALCAADGPTGLQVFNNSVVDTPSQVDTPEFADAVDSTDTHCFVADLPDGVGTEAPALHAVDVSNPDAPLLVDTLPLGGSPGGVAVAGNYAYVIAGDPGLFVIDISTPAAMRIVGQTQPLPTTGPIAIDTLRMRAYLGTTDTAGFPNDGLQIVDISNPAAPVLIGGVNLPGFTGGVVVDDGTVYAVTNELLSTAPGSLQIVDVSGF